jgi:tetratricopeptide (TPR) repeat protein
MRKNVSLSPTLAISWSGLGDGYRSLEEYPQAIESYERAFELQPGFQWAYRGLIGALVDQGRLEEARGHAEKLLETSPDNYSAVGWVGGIALFEGDQEKAELHYRRLEGRSTPIDFYGVTGLPPAVHLAHICMSTGRRSEAEEILKEEARAALSALAEGDERFRIPYTMAAINAIRGNQAETLQWLQKSIESGWRKHSVAQQDPIFAEFVGGSEFDALMQGVKQMGQESRRLAKEK